MWLRFKKFLAPPTFDDPDETRRAQNLNTILSALLVALLLWAWYPIFVQGGLQIAIALTAIGLVGGLYLLLKRGLVRLVGSLLSFLLWALVTVVMGVFGGIRNSGFAAIIIIVVIASLTLGTRGALVYTALSILAGGLLVVAENKGWLPPYQYEPNLTIFSSHNVTILAVGLLLILAIGNINRSLKFALSSEQKTKETVALLEQNRIELEQRSASLEQRNAALQLVAEVAQLSARIQDQRALLEQAIKLLAEKLDVDHIGAFLVDDLNENAVLYATNSEEGRTLLGNGYQLKVTTGLRSYSMPEDETLKYQVGDQTFLVSRPASLSESKTNLSFPLATAERLVGLINFQANSPEPWHVTAETFQIIANQIALSLENIRLVEQLQRRLQEIEHLAEKTTQAAWKRWASGNALGFQYNQLHTFSKSESFPERIHTALLAQKSASYTTSGIKPSARLVAPIILRNNVIGVLGYENDDPHHDWSANEKAMLETIASRVSLALENSRLVAEAQERAERERIVGNITAKMRETLDMDVILRTAVSEMQRSFELHEAEIRLQSPPAKPEGTPN